MIQLKRLLEDITSVDLKQQNALERIRDGWDSRAKQAANLLIERFYEKFPIGFGLSLNQSRIAAAAFVGNFVVESGVRPNVAQNRTVRKPDGLYFTPTSPAEAKNLGTGVGYGLAQWTNNGSRRSKLISGGASTIADQLNFVFTELKGTEESAWKKIKQNLNDIDAATAAVVTYYERAGVPNLTERQRYARTILNAVGGTTSSSKTTSKPNASSSTSTTSKPNASSSTSTKKTHTVKSGESLSVIAKKYGTTVTAIKKANRLTSDKITVGQKLIIN